MNSFDEISKYLPKYLTPDSNKALFSELEHFPNNLQKVFLPTNIRPNMILQGDGFKDLIIIDLPDRTIKKAQGMIISNSCDINPKNERLFKSNICYCPIIKLNKYKDALLKEHNEDKIEGHINSLKAQKITQVFYLPKGNLLEEDSFIFFDKIISIRSDILEKKKILNKKIFTLGNYGLYLFVVKLSIHFSRIYEEIDRREESCHSENIFRNN